jgi:acyl dehydratase
MSAFAPGQPLPALKRVVTQDDVRLYATASGDHNPLHLDAAFAATTQFGRPIAHGMFGLAMMSELMAYTFKQSWHTTGTLKARFKAPVYVGEEITVRGQVDRVNNNPDGDLLTCTVTMQNAKMEDVIAATATIRLPLEKAAQ